MPVTTLADFLLARFADDEAVARAAVDAHAFDEGRWLPRSDGYVISESKEDVTGQDATLTPQAAEHIARWDPARVLAECEAKRRIVEMHHPTGTWDGKTECGQCSFHEAYEGVNDVSELWPCPTLRLFALPYAGHPDHLEEWAVEPVDSGPAPSSSGTTVRP